ncbi:mitochondrial ribosomal protein S25-domain-containing protein [Fennellomyces sp. T-0311]|nr:mitochondrial ribosomal protein S25-domain-containing protein [Fennellomyces sp. T-0311]
MLPSNQRNPWSCVLWDTKTLHCSMALKKQPVPKLRHGYRPGSCRSATKSAQTKIHHFFCFPAVRSTMAYRVPPTKLEQHASNLLKGNLLKKAPVWLQAVRAIPPGPSIIRSRNPNVNVSAQTSVEKELFSTPTVNKAVSTRHKQKHLRTRPPRPAPIVYPEDRLRRQFYKDHPFELARPQTLVENKLGLNRTDYSQLLLPGMLPEEVTGET